MRLVIASCRAILFVAVSVHLSGCDQNPASTPTPTSPSEADASFDDAGRPTKSHRVLAASGIQYTTNNVDLSAIGIPSSEAASYFRSLPDSALEAKAKSGDELAKTFWIERLANDALLLQLSRKKSGNLPDGIEDGDIVASLGQMNYHLAALTQDPSNSMAGYLWGLTHAASIFGGPDEPIVAGIRLAGLRGDSRAVELEREFRAKHPGLDESKIEMYFQSGKREMEIAIRPLGP